MLVALLSIALLRGSIFGAIAGFGTGLMLDTATLGTLGVTSLLMTVGGFWIGRYGETTARDRFHAPYVSVAVVTVLYALGQLFLQFVLGEPAPAGVVVHALPLGLLVNLLLTLPVYASCGGSSRRSSSATACGRCASLAESPFPRGGRFLPGDPRVEEPYRLTPQTALRVAVLGFLALAVFAVLFLRLWALQVLSGDRYLSVANDNRVRTVRLEAPRGPIVDRNGHVLVGNVAGTARRALARRPSEDVGGAAAGAARARGRHGNLGQGHARAAERARRRPADAGRRAAGRSVGPGRLPARSTRCSSRESGPQNSFLRSYPYQSLAAQVVGYVGAISPRSSRRGRRRATRRPTRSVRRASSRRTTPTCAARTGRPS